MSAPASMHRRGAGRQVAALDVGRTTCRASGGRATLRLLEAIRTLGLTPRTAVRFLKEHPTHVTGLTEYRQALTATPGFGVIVVPVTPAHLTAAQILCAQEGLLTNDALLVAVTQALVLTDLASNDPDLARLPGLTLW